jgi:hypothetical protein
MNRTPRALTLAGDVGHGGGSPEVRRGSAKGVEEPEDDGESEEGSGGVGDGRDRAAPSSSSPAELRRIGATPATTCNVATQG